MIDREKVIRGLECCMSLNETCDICPYNYDGEGGENQCLRERLIPDALALLKEQQTIDTREEPHPIEVGDDGLPY